MPTFLHGPAQQHALDNQQAQVRPQDCGVLDESGEMPQNEEQRCEQPSVAITQPGRQPHLNVTAENALFGKADPNQHQQSEAFLSRNTVQQAEDLSTQKDGQEDQHKGEPQPVTEVLFSTPAGAQEGLSAI